MSGTLTVIDCWSSFPRHAYPYLIHRKSLLFPWIRNGFYGRNVTITVLWSMMVKIYHFRLNGHFDMFVAVSRLQDVWFLMCAETGAQIKQLLCSILVALPLERPCLQETLFADYVTWYIGTFCYLSPFITITCFICSQFRIIYPYWLLLYYFQQRDTSFIGINAGISNNTLNVWLFVFFLNKMIMLLRLPS